MTTITLNLETVDWINIEQNSIQVYYRRADGTLRMKEVDPISCEANIAEDNLYYLVLDIEDDIQELLSVDDRIYLEQKLLDTLEKWSRPIDDDDLYY